MNKEKKKIIGVVLCVLVIALAGAGIYLKQKAAYQAAIAVPDDEDNSGVITYKGKKYQYNPDIRAVLFLGVDRSEKVEVKSKPGEGGQADTLFLLVMNDHKKTVQMLEISRDTMTDISVYDRSGSFLAKEKAQVALQYAYGSSTKKSTQLTRNAVSKLLYGIPIRGVLTLDVDGVAKVTDAIGGVKITLQEDESRIDPSFTAGSEVVMNGAQAESFVRYRDTDVTGSNDDRMERQDQFLKALIGQLQNTDINTLYDTVTGSAGEYLYTDLTVNQMKKFAQYTFTEKTCTLPGEMKSGKEHDEFYADDTKLYENVLRWFYKPADR